MLRTPRPPVEPLTDAREPGRLSHQAEPYKSQAFTLWDEGIGAPGKRLILDLGSARSSNVAYFSEQPTRLYIADLRSELPVSIPEMDDEDADERADLESRALRHVLPQLEDESQHGALCWDLMNYLTRPQVAVMGEWLSGKLKLDGMVMLSLVTGAQMPDQPDHYEIAGEGALIRTQEGNATTDSPRFTQGDLKRLWPQFEVVRSYLMRDERQEFVLRRS